MARIDRAARPTRITAADRARQRRAIARHDARIARTRRRERVARLVVWACAIATAVALFYGATEPDPPRADTYRAVTWDGATVAGGLTMPECLENYFNRPDVAGCERD